VITASLHTHIPRPTYLHLCRTEINGMQLHCTPYRRPSPSLGRSDGPRNRRSLVDLILVNLDASTPGSPSSAGSGPPVSRPLISLGAFFVL